MATETLDVTSMLPNQYEPKMTNRWILQIEGVDAFLLKTAQRPTFKTEQVPISWMNATRYVAGKTTFDPISITLGDAVAPSAAQQSMEWLRLCYESVSGRGGYADFYKRSGALKLTDAIGNVIELWELSGLFMTELTYGDLTYEESKPLDIAIVLSVDNAVLQF